MAFYYNGYLTIYNRKGWIFISGTDWYHVDYKYHDKKSVTYRISAPGQKPYSIFLNNLKAAREAGLKAYFSPTK